MDEEGILCDSIRRGFLRSRLRATIPAIIHAVSGKYRIRATGVKSDSEEPERDRAFAAP